MIGAKMHDLREIKPEQIIVITELTNILPHDIIKLQKDKIFIDPISNDLHFDFSSINDGEVMNIHGIIKLKQWLQCGVDFIMV